MSVNQKIETAVKGIIEDIWPLCCPLELPPDEYIVYNPEIEKADFFADDQDQEWIQYVQVHLYTKKNYVQNRKEIRRRLREHGFMVTDIITLHEKNSGYYHMCFSCYIEEED